MLSNPSLHAFTGVAELKREQRTANAAEPLRLHAFTGVAELKPNVNLARKVYSALSPRLHRRGRIEAWR